MQNLSKEGAITLSYALWLWMKENKETDKAKWPGWDKFGKMRHDCPCCQYVGIEKSMGRWNCMESADCIDSCPLLNIWPAKKASDNIPCCRKNSPFTDFERFEGNKGKLLEIVCKMEAAIKKEMKRLKIKPLKI